MKRINAYDFLKGQWLSQAEAAEVLGCSEDTVRRRCDDGLLKRRYDGRTPRICAYSVQQYMNEQYTESK
jgi:excisionase family DNA binding protein